PPRRVPARAFRLPGDGGRRPVGGGPLDARRVRAVARSARMGSRPARATDRVALVLADRLRAGDGGRLPAFAAARAAAARLDSRPVKRREDVDAAVLPAPGRPIEMRRFPAPRPGPGGAVLETVGSEVCGTDVHLFHGRLSGVPYPIIPGHVVCGRLAESTAAIRGVEGRPIADGTLVTFYDVFGTCGACWHC